MSLSYFVVMIHGYVSSTCVSGCLIFHLLKVRIDVAKTILNDAWIGHDKGIVGAFVLSL